MRIFYQYLIYKLYSWGLNKKGDTPVTNVILTLSVVHLIQFLSINAIIVKLFSVSDVLENVSITVFGFFMVAFIIAHYFLFYKKKRWEEYVEKFKDETLAESKKGKRIVLSYLIGSILLFFILMPVLFGF